MNKELNTVLLENEFVKLFNRKKIKWKLDHNIILYLRRFNKIAKKYDSNYVGALKDAIDWIRLSPSCSKKAKAGSNAKSRRMAEILLKGSIPKLYKGSSMWFLHDGIDLEMVGSHLSDCADHLEIACSLYEGDLKKAYKLSDLDTSSRDMIPAKVWDFINKYDRD